ncbi:MAG: response regulator transcription factor [Dehalococcoidia bacterium]|nr:MAG: response regulator transcription factor [Dehalococcoidia bacterium]
MNTVVTMIIDDRPFFRAGVRGFLILGECSEGMEIIDCDAGRDGNDAVMQIATYSPDVVILDIGYPVRSGLDLCKKIIRTFPNTRVVMISSNPEEDDDELLEAIKVGAASYRRSKECQPEEFAETIRRASVGDYPVNDLMSSRPKVAWRVLRQFQEITANVRQDDDIVAPLTAKEMQILTLVAEGNQNKRIARILGISEQTIKNHVSAIMRKLNANDRAHAVMLAMRNGLVSIEPGRTWGRRRGDLLSEAPTSSVTDLN